VYLYLNTFICVFGLVGKVWNYLPRDVVMLYESLKVIIPDVILLWEEVFIKPDQLDQNFKMFRTSLSKYFLIIAANGTHTDGLIFRNTMELVP